MDCGELDGLGVGISDFENSTLTAKIFLSGIVAMLRKTAFCDLPDNVSVKVARLKNDVVIYILPSAEKEEKRTFTYCAYIFQSTEELVNFCKIALKPFIRRIDGGELFTLGKNYGLIVKFRYAYSTLASKKELKAGAVTNEISIAKIREYGKLLSRTPLEKILAL